MSHLHVLVVSVALLAIPSCQPPEAKPSPSDLLGLWRSVGGQGMPKACEDATMEFRTDGTMLVETGPQILTANFTMEGAGRRLAVVQKDIRSNGEPNCQGISAEYVLAHYVNTFYAEIRRDTLRVYARSTDRMPFLSAIRVKKADTSLPPNKRLKLAARVD